MLQKGEIILKRSFFLEGDEWKQVAVTVRFATPFRPEGEYARCRFELTSPDGTKEMSADGLDALDGSAISHPLTQGHPQIGYWHPRAN